MKTDSNVELQLTPRQIELLIECLEFMPDSIENQHLVSFLKYKGSAKKQEELLSLNACANV